MQGLEAEKPAALQSQELPLLLVRERKEDGVARFVVCDSWWSQQEVKQTGTRSAPG
jgi:hypothetical protein